MHLDHTDTNGKCGVMGLFERRMFLIVLVYAGVFGLFLIRLLWLQSFAAVGYDNLTGELAQASVMQRRETVVLDSGRGRILDRNGIILAGEQVHALLIIPRMSDWHDTDLANQVSVILGIKREWIASQTKLIQKPYLIYTSSLKSPMILTDDQVLQLNRLHSPAFKVVPYTRRFLEHPLAAHVIGYLGQNPQLLQLRYSEQLNRGDIQIDELVGASGIERSFDPLLHGVSPLTYTHYVDGQSEALVGLQDRLTTTSNPFYPLKVKTTLDSKLQASTEAMMDKLHMKEGAIVVLDVENADVLVMASRPNYDPYSVIPQQGLWRNRALSAEIPGSIFKTVVLATALEDGIVKPHQKFYCSGEWDRYHLRCWVREGHGVLTLEQAYAESCNVIIAQIAAKLRPERLEEVGRSLGLFRQVGWSTDRLSYSNGSISPFRQFDAEQSGQLFDKRTTPTDSGVMAQTGIGQRDVRVSALQAANMIVTLLHAGHLSEPRIVTDIMHQNNRHFIHFPKHELKQAGVKAISAKTARWLTEAMKLTVQSGTASSLLKVPVEVAGKTGTAELNGTAAQQVNEWFIGYTPTEKPKYAFAVLVSNNSDTSEQRALAITEQLIRILDK
jgi:cell division protein FtsI/penicillin-binding protein 2